MSVRFRRLLSGAPDGTPPWLDVVAAGEEPGLYLPSDAPWVVHADFGTLVGGIRALLVQALHPGTLRGVMDHSRYAEDPLGRLAGTIRWLTVTTFGSHTAVAHEAARVNGLHKRVTGSYETNDGGSRDYRASDPDLLLWVHIAFMESFLECHKQFAWRDIPGGDDRYISQWSASVQPLGLTRVPKSKDELDREIANYLSSNTLRVDERTQQVVKFLKQPPIPGFAGFVYGLLFDAAVISLRPEYQHLLGLKPKPAWLVRKPIRGLLRLMRWVIGPESPIEDAAVARLVRIGAWPASTNA